MPNNVLVWVQRLPLHSQVYVDESLFTAGGDLTLEGAQRVDAALGALRPDWSLKSAQICNRAALRGVAG